MKKKNIHNIIYKEVLTSIIKDINNKLPIKLLDNYSLINNIHEQYPLLEKEDIALIVKYFFESIREILLSGKTISFNNVISNINMKVYKHTRDKNDYVLIKVKVSTPEDLK